MNNNNSQTFYEKHWKKMLVSVVIIVITWVILRLTVLKKNEEDETRRNRVSDRETEVKTSETQKEVREEMEEIKDRLRNMETYKMKEYYVSKDGNNGLTLGGTIVEQMIDVAIEIFKQPLVKELSSKMITKKEDAVEMSKYIEQIGKVVVESVKSNPVLKCAAPVVTECEGEGEEEKCKTYADPNYEVGDEDCKLYRPNKVGINNIKKSVLVGIRSILDNPSEQDTMYNLFKSLAEDNVKFVASMNNKSEAEVEKMLLGIPEKEAWISGLKSSMDNSVTVKSDEELRKDEPIVDGEKFDEIENKE